VDFHGEMRQIAFVDPWAFIRTNQGIISESLSCDSKFRPGLVVGVINANSELLFTIVAEPLASG